MAIVGGGQKPYTPPNSVAIMNREEQAGILEFMSPVCDVLLTHKELYVLLKTRVYRYDTRSLTVLHSYQADGSRIKCSPNGEVVAFTNEGEVIVERHGNTRTIKSFKESPMIALNETGDRIICCGDHAQQLRVFDTVTGTLIFEFKRKSTSPIYNICTVDNFLVLNSNRCTVHVFYLNEEKKTHNEVCTYKLDQDKSGFIHYVGDDHTIFVSVTRRGIIHRMHLVNVNEKYSMNPIDTLQTSFASK